MILYSARRTTYGYLLAKFDDDFNVAAVYEIDAKGGYGTDFTCSCPSAKRPCKHVSMIGTFEAAQRIDTDWFLDESSRWHQPLAPYLVEEGRPRLSA